jgi:hypothetical protein
MSKSTGSHYTRPGRCVSRSDKREWTRHLLAKLNKINARTGVNVAICRTFSRAMLLLVIARERGCIDCSL